MSCNAETEAQNLFNALTNGIGYEIPSVNWNDAKFQLPDISGAKETVTRLTNESLTQREFNGTGSFDALMASVSAHVKREYEEGRITGAEYSKTYVALTEAAMANAVQFLLNRENAYWQAITAQLGAVNSLAAIELTKAQVAQTQMQGILTKAEFANTKHRLANLSGEYCSIKYNYEYILPSQLAINTAQKTKIDAETANTEYSTSTVLPGQVSHTTAQTSKTDAERLGVIAQTTKVTPEINLLTAQKDKVAEDILMSTAQRTQLLPAQVTLATQQGLVAIKEVALKEKEVELATYNVTYRLPAEVTLLKEKTESERANTLDNRGDGAAVTGVLGSQKALYREQVQSYRKDALVKMAKPFIDYEIAFMSVNELATPNPGVATAVSSSATKLNAVINSTVVD